MDLLSLGNEVYDIHLLPEEDQYNYGVWNKHFERYEHKCFQLPSAIHVAYELWVELERLKEEEVLLH